MKNVNEMIKKAKMKKMPPEDMHKMPNGMMMPGKEMKAMMKKKKMM